VATLIEVAEVRMILHAMKGAMTKGWIRVWIQGDNLKVTSSLKATTAKGLEIGTVLGEILAHARNFDICK